MAQMIITRKSLSRTVRRREVLDPAQPSFVDPSQSPLSPLSRLA
jgi:hypothetical protein